jgi:UDP-N-acetylglucosamine--N-acetylmuramyl-(pentapeptide) pyrophosphoryl-undecaprenol N-acetylglucosamine transferase
MARLACHSPHIVFSGGVTGGHLFPGMAVAEQIIAMSPAAKITFAGPGGPFDREQVARAGYGYFPLACPRAPRGIADAARFGYGVLRGFGAAAAMLEHTHASAVVGLGGFASVPVALAAARRNLPLLLLEQNAIVGRANRCLARWADALCLGFEQGPQDMPKAVVLPQSRTIVTGTPIRKGFLQNANHVSATIALSVGTAASPQHAVGAIPVLLVLGGSGGARLLNQALPSALAELRLALCGWQVIHQTGTSDAAATAGAYAAAGISATVIPFVHDLPALLPHAQLAVCRSGGSTLAELAAMSVPTVLVPWAGSMDDHQRHNARAFDSAGAAVMIDANVDEPAPLARRLSLTIGGLLTNPDRRAAMARAMGSLARPRAARLVAEMALNLSDGGRSRRRERSPVPLVCPSCIDARAA